MEQFKYSDRYKFTESWFDPMIPTWTEAFKWYEKEVGKINNVLEIGCYEGRATVWLCENVLTHNDIEYDIIDTFEGTPNESGMSGTVERLTEENSVLENTFRHNIWFFKNIQFNIHKGYSQQILPNLVRKYDFIYIDASHRADDTFVDAYYAHKLLKSKGMMIFDDYGWKDPKDLHMVNSPEMGIKMFLNMYDREYDCLFNGYQIGLIKK